MNPKLFNELLAALPEPSEVKAYCRSANSNGEIVWLEQKQGRTGYTGSAEEIIMARKKKAAKPKTIEELFDDMRKRPRIPTDKSMPRELDFNESSPRDDYEDLEPDYDEC